jgi:hypothetical protein
MDRGTPSQSIYILKNSHSIEAVAMNPCPLKSTKLNNLPS